MYVNTFICLDENIAGYGMNKKAPTGHVTIMTPGLIRCYVENLVQRGNPYVLYLLSKANNKAVRVGEINPSNKDKETRWKTDIENIFNSGIKGNAIDAAAIVIEGNTAGNTDAILTGFTNDKYLIVPLLEQLIPKKNTSKVMPKEEVKVETKMPTPKVMPKVEEVKIETKMPIPEAIPKVMPKVEEVKIETKMPIPEVIPKVMPKVEEVKIETKMSTPTIMPKEEAKIETKMPIPKANESKEQEDQLKEKIKKLLEDQLKDAINGVLNIEQVDEQKNQLNEAIKDKVQEIVISDMVKKQEKQEKPVQKPDMKESEKIDFCDDCEECTQSERAYLDVVDQQLRLLEKKLQDTKVQIINMRKENVKENIDSNEEKNEDVQEDFLKTKIEDIPEEYDNLGEYLDYTRAEEIFRSSDTIYPFEAKDEDRDWVKISLAELMSIPQLSYEWCTNPCITFCVHKYGHLILGKDRNIGQYYIGIPDQYHPARRSMLATDRIERFLCCKDINPMVGEYGYWMINI